MLAAVASVALAAPAFAWDFSASGSATASFNQTSTKANGLAATKEATTGTGFSSAGSSLKLASSHTDGPNTASLTYTLDFDGNLDETIAVSGSKKVGKWTASGSVSYAVGDPAGCYGSSDNGSGGTGVPTSCGKTLGKAQTGEDSTSVTLTDGTMTIVMGNATHLSSQNKSSGTGAAGQDGMDSAGADCDVGACVDDFEGVSLGYKISDTMSVTVAYQQENDLVMGTGEALDGEASHIVTGFGLGFSGTFGPATVGFTQASGSSADATADADAGKLSTSWSTMGVGIAIDLGDIDPFITIGSAEGSAGSAANSKVKHAHSGNEVGLTYALGADTITLLIGSMSDQFDTASTVDKPQTTSIMEVGYATMVGPASLSVGYGTSAKADADKGTSNDGYSMTDLDVALSISF